MAQRDQPQYAPRTTDTKNSMCNIACRSGSGGCRRGDAYPLDRGIRYFWEKLPDGACRPALRMGLLAPPESFS